MDVMSFSDSLVVVASLFTPIILAPQILRMWQLKDAHAVSLLTFLGSLVLQVILLHNAYLHGQVQIVISMLLSIIPLCILLCVACYFRFRE
jgi:uncharacterized protein with PQ loop repeat